MTLLQLSRELIAELRLEPWQLLFAASLLRGTGKALLHVSPSLARLSEHAPGLSPRLRGRSLGGSDLLSAGEQMTHDSWGTVITRSRKER